MMTGPATPDLNPLLNLFDDHHTLEPPLTNLIVIFRALENLETIEFMNSPEPILSQDGTPDNDSNELMIEQLEPLRGNWSHTRGPPPTSFYVESGTFLDDLALKDVVPWIFNALYSSKRPLKNFLCNLSHRPSGAWLAQNHGVAIPEFPETDEAVEGYQNVFGNLETLQLKVRALLSDVWAPVGVPPVIYPYKPSRWFETLKKLEILSISHDDDSRSHTKSRFPGEFLAYPLRIEAALPRLRTLELRRCKLRLDSLTRFLISNKKTIRKLILEGNEYHELSGYRFSSTKQDGDNLKPHTPDTWMNFFANLRTNMKLEEFAIDVPGKSFGFRIQTVLVYFTVYGKWDDQSTICEVRSRKGCEDHITMNLSDCLDHVQVVLEDAIKAYTEWE
ncbi:hypothetical protein TWF281_011141 [Arthrobotrys megalospora]